MTKEVGEIVFEMEKNLNNPMRTLQKLCGSNFYKMIGKGDFGEVMRWDDEEDIWNKLRKDLGSFLWRLWVVMKKKQNC